MVKINPGELPDLSLLNADLLAEANVLREEMGSLVRELRDLIKVVRKSNGDWTPGEILEAMEDIING